MVGVLNSFRFTSAPTLPTFIGRVITNLEVTLHASTQAGDLVVIYVGEADGGAGMSGGAGSWNSIGVSNGRAYWKLVAAGDLGVPLTPDVGGANSALIATTIRGANSAHHIRYTTDGSVSTITSTGFTRDAGHLGIMAMTKGDGASASSVSIGNANLSSPHASGDTYSMKSTYLIDDSYVSGTDVVWTMGGINPNLVATLLEIR